jgi:hypothetical protein
MWIDIGRFQFAFRVGTAKIEFGAGCLDLVTAAFHLRDGLIKAGNVLKIEKAFGQFNDPKTGCFPTLIG